MALILIFILFLSIVMIGDARAIDDARARKIREEKAFKKDVCQLLQKMIRIDKNTSINPDAPFTGTSMYSLDTEVFRKLQTPAAPHPGQALLGAAEIDYRIFYKKHCEVAPINLFHLFIIDSMLIMSLIFMVYSMFRSYRNCEVVHTNLFELFILGSMLIMSFIFLVYSLSRRYRNF